MSTSRNVTQKLAKNLTILGGMVRNGAFTRAERIYPFPGSKKIQVSVNFDANERGKSEAIILFRTGKTYKDENNNPKEEVRKVDKISRLRNKKYVRQIMNVAEPLGYKNINDVYKEINNSVESFMAMTAV